MASTTPNIGLTLPTGTEGWKRSVINGNFMILDTKIGAVGNTSLQSQINTLSSNLPTFTMVEDTKTTGATGNIATVYQGNNKTVICGATALNADCYLRAWRATGNGGWYLTAVNPNTGETVNNTSLNIRYLVITLK